jgi:hypothetical protein
VTPQTPDESTGTNAAAFARIRPGHRITTVPWLRPADIRHASLDHLAQWI